MKYSLILELLNNVVIGTNEIGLMEEALKGVVAKRVKVVPDKSSVADVSLKNGIELKVKCRVLMVTVDTDDFVCEDGSIFKAFSKFGIGTFSNEFCFGCGLKYDKDYYLLYGKNGATDEIGSLQCYYYDEAAIDYYMTRKGMKESFSPVAEEELSAFGLLPDKVYNIDVKDNETLLKYFGALISDPNKFFDIVGIIDSKNNKR